MARYIDADKLHIQMEDLYEHHIEMGNYRADGAVADCLDMLDNTPAADVVEVKYGEWIDKREGKYANPTYVCSNCGEKALLECYINELRQWMYRQSLSMRCPHCGAKMDGGKAE